ncbi:SBBP repeat-containing protein, partial [bacterium]|nr:SBBP repeat-containing protein [bacterium]
MKKSLLPALFAILTISVSANINSSELDKFNSAKSSVSFTENKGQISDQNYNPRPDVLFSGAANGLTFHIRKDGISYQTSRVDSWKEQDENLSEGMVEEGKIDSVPDQMTIYRTDINWLGFNKDYTIENGESTAGFNNYYLPSCPDGAMNVKSYTDVTFKNLYTGVDVKWYVKNGELEYDFIVAPNTDYTKIAWEIQGAEKISIGEDGQLIIKTPLGEIEEQAPIAFQGETQVEAAWKIDGNKISFQLGSYNENEVLIIDPVVRQWGTYYGGTSTEIGYSCATDASGNVYLAGDATSTTGIATTGAHKTTMGGVRDAFLVKFNSSGVRQWGTFYGGTGYDKGRSCATDTSGNIYLAGQTRSNSGIATTGAHQTTYGGSEDAFLVKFNSSGVRQWGTYYGGTAYDYGYSCATDGSGNVYLAGASPSTTGIATTGAHQTTYGGYRAAFLVKFNSSGVRQWGTYYGGTGEEYGNSCATDASGNVYLSGYTTSTTGIATTGAHQATYGSSGDAFLVKFNSSGVRQWGTYYGGTSYDYGYSCATDGSGNVYLAGASPSTTGIATTGAHQTTFGGYRDAFLVKFNSSGVRQWGTYYGGTGEEYGNSCATDASGNVYLAGDATSTTGIATTGAHKTTMGGVRDAFLVKFNSSGVRQWGTFYGGTGYDK